MVYLPQWRASQTSPGKNDNLPLVTVTSTVWGSGSIGLSLVWQSRPPQVGLICDSCSSARNFALRRTFQPPQSGFLLIPSRDGHPCLWLTVPAAESVVDFHHQVVAHAGRTEKRRGCICRPRRSISRLFFRNILLHGSIGNTAWAEITPGAFWQGRPLSHPRCRASR